MSYLPTPAAYHRCFPRVWLSPTPHGAITNLSLRQHEKSKGKTQESSRGTGVRNMVRLAIVTIALVTIVTIAAVTIVVVLGIGGASKCQRQQSSESVSFNRFHAFLGAVPRCDVREYQIQQDSRQPRGNLGAVTRYVGVIHRK